MTTDVLVEIGLVRKLKTLLELCHVENVYAQWVTQVVTPADSRLLFAWSDPGGGR